MTYTYSLGYMQGLRGQALCVFGIEDEDEHLAGYVKGCAMRQGDVLMHKQLVSRYNK